MKDALQNVSWIFNVFCLTTLCMFIGPTKAAGCCWMWRKTCSLAWCYLSISITPCWSVDLSNASISYQSSTVRALRTHVHQRIPKTFNCPYPVTSFAPPSGDRPMCASSLHASPFLGLPDSNRLGVPPPWLETQWLHVEQANEWITTAWGL